MSVLRIRPLAGLYLALALGCLAGVAAPVRAADDEAQVPAENELTSVDYGKVLYQVTVSPRIRFPREDNMRDVLESVAHNTALALGKAFFDHMSFVESDLELPSAAVNIREREDGREEDITLLSLKQLTPILIAEAEKRRIGYVIAAVVDEFVVRSEDRNYRNDETEERSRVAFQVSQQMFVQTPGGWKPLYSNSYTREGRTSPTAEGGLTGLGAFDNPAERPFLNVMLPVQVLAAQRVKEKEPDERLKKGRILDRVAAKVRVTNNLPVPVSKFRVDLKFRNETVYEEMNQYREVTRKRQEAGYSYVSSGDVNAVIKPGETKVVVAEIRRPLPHVRGVPLEGRSREVTLGEKPPIGLPMFAEKKAEKPDRDMSQRRPPAMAAANQPGGEPAPKPKNHKRLRSDDPTEQSLLDAAHAAFELGEQLKQAAGAK